MSDHYKLHGMTEWRGEIVDLAYRRVRPFLDQSGLQTRSVEHLMAESYMQGIKDAVAAQAKDDEPLASATPQQRTGQ